MKTFHADVVFEAAVLLTNLGNTNLRGNISDPEREELIKELNNHLKVLNLTDLRVSAKHVEDIVHIQAKIIADYDHLSEQVETLKTIIDLELESILCLRIDANKVDLYQKPNPFGEHVTNQFPAAAFDIEEAGKCYACNRNTACVMHLARVVEVGLKAAMQGLGLSVATGKQPSWGEVLRDMWNEIGARNKAAAPAWLSQQKSFFENIHADLSSVKNAWRNPSMHADKVYDPERAEDIYNAVKGFMRHLAEHLDETGNFTP